MDDERQRRGDGWRDVFWSRRWRKRRTLTRTRAWKHALRPTALLLIRAKITLATRQF